MTAALEKGVSGQQYAPASLYLRERTGTYFTGGWVGPQGRSGRVENLVSPGIRSRTVQPVAQSLYRLSYRASHELNVTTLNSEKHLEACLGLCCLVNLK